MLIQDSLHTVTAMINNCVQVHKILQRCVMRFYINDNHHR